MCQVPRVHIYLERNSWVAKPECPECDFGLLIEVGGMSREYVKNTVMMMLIEHLYHSHRIFCATGSIQCIDEY